MRITSVTIECEGNVHGDVEIARIEGGARVTHVFCKPSRTGSRQHREVLCEVMAAEDGDARFAMALKVAAVIYGTDRRGRANATNSTVHDVFDQINRVAGC